MPSLINARRAADTLLRTAGGRRVLLRLPSPATPGDATEQLGLATPLFQDLVLEPVVFRKARPTVTSGNAPRWELLVSASAVEAAVGSLTSDSAAVLFDTAFGVLVDGALMEIEWATASEVFDKPYLYRLLLQMPRSAAA